MPRVATGLNLISVGGMPLTAEQIVQETSQWPVDAVADLVERITLAKMGGLDTQREAAWLAVALKRSAELDNGQAELIPADEAARFSSRGTR